MNFLKKYKDWEKIPLSSNEKNELNSLKKNNNLFEDAFYKNLEFGTGGMRGIMGIGSNRINRFTIGKATQGLSNYLKKVFNSKKITAIVAFDCRNNSQKYARIVADIFSANEIKCYLFNELRPTPLLSFGLKRLKAHCGIVITASHNPPSYNGFKVYWEDGGQIVPPNDKKIIDEINSINFNEIIFKPKQIKTHLIKDSVDKEFIKMSCEIANLNFTDKEKYRIAFTNLHGTAITLIPKLLKKAGFSDIHMVKEQLIPDGDFPTVKSPNPEEAEALKMGINLSKSINADILIGTDPDADRLGICVRDNDDQLIILNGNQTMILLTRFLIENFYDKIKLSKKFFIATTLVSTPMMSKIADDYGIECKLTLTGFKWIAKLIEDCPDQKIICGGEESYGFMVGDIVRDKDAITSSLLACNLGSYLKQTGSSIFEFLIESYIKHGYFKEKMISVTKKGKKGLNEILKLMKFYRESPPDKISNLKIKIIEDYLVRKEKNINNKKSKKINFPKSDFIRFILEDNSIISIRPSGTEPKVKFYISVRHKLYKKEDYFKIDMLLEDKIKTIINGLKIN